MLSHWRGDADSIYGNVLIPDTIRKESDSDYGGMISVSNSETGMRVIGSLPSVFRAICMNGCIWDQESGKGIHMRHIGEIDLAELRSQIESNLTRQIPLLNAGIERVLGLRAFGCGDAPLLNVFAQIGQDFKFTKKQVKGVIEAYGEEAKILGSKEAKSAFGIVGAITRFGQTLPNNDWVRFDMIAGSIVNMARPKWDATLRRAKELTDADIERLVLVA